MRGGFSAPKGENEDIRRSSKDFRKSSSAWMDNLIRKTATTFRNHGTRQKLKTKKGKMMEHNENNLVDYIAKDLKLSAENKATLQTKAGRLMNFRMAKAVRYGILNDFAKQLKAINN